MHGFWMRLARVPFTDWLRPTWWPWWDAGMPLEFTYAPLVPWLMRGVSLAGGVSVSRAFHIVTVLVYCAAPVTLYLACRRLSGSVAFSFAAALFYSLSSTASFLTPPSGFAWKDLGDAWRMYVAFDWDEAPHLLTMALFPLALWGWVALMERPRRRTWVAAVLLTASTVLANAFGGTLLGLSFLCLLLSRPAADWRPLVLRVGLASILAYLLISPWLPPSLVHTIRANSNAYPEGAWEPTSGKALAIVVAAWLVGALLLRRLTRDWFFRFWAQLAVFFAGVVLVHRFAHWHFLPQSGRYKVEMEMAVAVAVVFALRPLLRRLPVFVPALLALALIPVVVEQTIAHRRYAKNLIRAHDESAMFESRLARQLAAVDVRPRVFAPGTLAMWLNHFVDLAQVSGGSFPTAVNPVQQMAVEGIYGRTGPVEMLWLRAFAAGVVVVVGPDGGEFWKPYRDPGVIEQQLTPLWRETGAGIYAVPVRPESLAYVVPELALVRKPPKNGGDVADLQRYVAALQGAPPAAFVWRNSNQASVRADTHAGEVVSIAINYHSGWRAVSGGQPVRLRTDGIGLMVAEPRVSGPAQIDLEYTGGLEAYLTRGASLGVGILGLVWLLRRRRGASGDPEVRL